MFARSLRIAAGCSRGRAARALRARAGHGLSRRADIDRVAARRSSAGKTTVLIPIGGTEQNGPTWSLGKHNVRVKAALGEDRARARQCAGRAGDRLRARRRRRSAVGRTCVSGHDHDLRRDLRSVLEDAARSLRAARLSRHRLPRRPRRLSGERAGRGAAARPRMGEHAGARPCADRVLPRRPRPSIVHALAARGFSKTRSASMPGSPIRRCRWPSIPRSCGRASSRPAATSMRRTASTAIRAARRAELGRLGVDAIVARDRVDSIRRRTRALTAPFIRSPCTHGQDHFVKLQRLPRRCPLRWRSPRCSPSARRRTVPRPPARAARGRRRCPACRRWSTRQPLQRDRGRQTQPGGRATHCRASTFRTQSDDVYVIDPATLKVVDRFRVGLNPQHVVPSWDLTTLWVANNAEGRTDGSLTPIDPTTGKPGKPIPVDDPYNMYFTPGRQVGDRRRRGPQAARFPRSQDDGAPVVARRHRAAPASITPTSRSTARYAIFTCEFARRPGRRSTVVDRKVVGYLDSCRQRRHAAGHPHLARRQAPSTSRT